MKCGSSGGQESSDDVSQRWQGPRCLREGLSLGCQGDGGDAHEGAKRIDMLSIGSLDVEFAYVDVQDH